MAQHGNLNVDTFIEPSFGENTYLLWPADGRECWIVDPGLPSVDLSNMVARIRKLQLKPRAILITHGHFDHIGGVQAVREELGDVPVVCSAAEADLLADPEENLSASLGFLISVPGPDQVVQPGDELELDDLSWKVLDVSGHSPGGVAYYCPSAGVVIVGDSLFAEGIGRYDFPHGDRERLLTNIRENLLTLPGETWVYAGHGAPAQLDFIMAHNRVLRAELDEL